MDLFSLAGAVDPRNLSLFVSLNGKTIPAAEARVSVFDAGFLFGDGVWEGLRLREGRIAFLDAHFQRLWRGAAMLGFDPGVTRPVLARLLFDCLAANGMDDGADVRIVLSRGPLAEAGGGGATVLILPRWRRGDEETALRLATVHQRASGPAGVERRLGALSRVEDVLASLQARQAGAEEALMLDDRGCVAGCASADLFMVSNGEVWTPAGARGHAGVTRSAVLRAARRAGVPAHEKDFSLLDLYCADEIFLASPFGELKPVSIVDGRSIGEKSGDADESGPMTRWMRDLYRELANEESRGR